MKFSFCVPPTIRFCLLFLLVTTCSFAANKTSLAASQLTGQLQPLIDAHDGQVGVAITHLTTGETFTHRADEPMPTASLIKFPLMIATYQAIEDKKLTLDKNITLRAEDMVPGSGSLAHFSPGTTFSLHDAIHLMISYSDNTATNLVINQVGLPVTAKLMESFDCPNTKMHSQVYRGSTTIYPKRSQKFGLGSTSAAEMIQLLKALNAETLVSKTASKQMLAQLLNGIDRTKCGRELPAGTKYASKSGSVSAVQTDAGIIFSPSGPIAICVLTADNEDQRRVPDNAAQVLCGRIARVAYDHFNPNQTSGDKSQALAIGANGRIVEALQRTLNARSKPSPGISVDGDFGPGTLKAVKAFQRQSNLADTGIVDAKTWKALGTLLDKDPKLPPPDVINAKKINKKPADTLTGRPFVTCKAWGIGDAETGKLLWGFNADQARDMASTTKILTAYLVTSLAEKDPSILDEVVTFTARADNTVGSTAGIRAGEKLPVGELLYGLLLPSGNDASVALGEHFGKRLAKKTAENGAGHDAYAQFVAAMNTTAKRLGMNDSNFENTHGLTAPNHKTSPRDLIKLAQHAMQQPLFRKVVGTVQHGCTVTGPEGYQRNLIWRNTNRLLRTEGYNGVKTGTTTPAGSCLVSHGTRSDKSLIIVVLGSSSTDARYADSQNLYRWAWQQLETQK